MRAALIALLLVGCSNDAAEFARFLDGNARCMSITTRGSRFGDVALCSRELVLGGKPQTERWLCTARPLECVVLGTTVRYVIVTEPTAEVPR